MGLDMYLTARLYTSEFSHKAAYEVLANLELPEVMVPPQYIENIGSFQIEVPVAYWRKANHIHAWFVAEVQGGNDDCGHYYVDIDKLRELSKLCSEVAASNSPKLAAVKLPTADGFFFGGKNYDEWYFEQTRNTLAGLEKLLADHDADKLKGWEFYYHSSW